MQTATIRSNLFRRTASSIALPTAILVALASAVSGCMGQGSSSIDAVGLAQETPLPDRRGTVLVDGCAIDTFQDAVLASPSTRNVVDEVLLACLVPRDSGEVGPQDASARSELARVVATLHGRGYRVSLGLSFTDETGARYDRERTRTLLASTSFRTTFPDRATTFATEVRADALDLDLTYAPTTSRADVTALASALSSAARSSKLGIGIFVPPSVSIPSDLPDGEAFDLAALAPLVDRIRVMTVDYSDLPGPTTDSGWATDAARLAGRNGRPIDVAVPLYGVDYGPRGKRGVSVIEARGLASTYGARLERGPTGTLFFRYVAGGETHELWFDDTESTGRALGAFAESLPSDVGILYYGLGAEDPTLFSTLAERTR
jgi:spore germination protein YaaH